MKIKDFGVEQWMNEYETKAKYNLRDGMNQLGEFLAKLEQEAR